MKHDAPPLRDVGELPHLEPIAADPEYARAAALLGRFKAKTVELEGRIEALSIAGYLEALDPLEAAQHRSRLQERPARSDAPSAGGPRTAADGLPPAVVKALPLLEGDRSSTALEPEIELKQLRRNLRVLGEACRAQIQVVADLRSTKSAAAARKLKSAHAQRLVAVYRAGQRLAAAIASVTEVNVALHEAGFELSSHLLAQGGLPAARAIGSDSEFDSQLSHLRRDLEQQGLL